MKNAIILTRMGVKTAVNGRIEILPVAAESFVKLFH
jgi:hypothetical protein